MVVLRSWPETARPEAVPELRALDHDRVAFVSHDLAHRIGRVRFEEHAVILRPFGQGVEPGNSHIVTQPSPRQAAVADEDVDSAAIDAADRSDRCLPPKRRS
jgi:hypothetical protein